MTDQSVKPEIQDSSDLTARQRLAQLFAHFKTQPLYAIYHLLSLVFIWSAVWFFADTWATGENLTAVSGLQSLWIPLRHLALATVGLTLLSLEDTSLQVLVTMKTPPALSSADNRKALFSGLQQRFPHLASLYTIVGIALCWCGTWGLVLDIPIRPWLRSLLTLTLGLLMLYIDSQAEAPEWIASEDGE
ncbi:MAG: hypothetical protein AAF329_03935 [Cyanobacteria bacterium P01_A01_bin.17]